MTDIERLEATLLGLAEDLYRLSDEDRYGALSYVADDIMMNLGYTYKDYRWTK